MTTKETRKEEMRTEDNKTDVALKVTYGSSRDFIYRYRFAANEGLFRL